MGPYRPPPCGPPLLASTQTTDRANCDSSTTFVHTQVIATSILHPGTAACGTPKPTHCTRERGQNKKKMMRGARAQAQQPSPRLPRFLFHLLSLGFRHNSLARFLYDTLFHPVQLSHRLRVVVSPVSAACPLRPLDTQFWLTLREWHDQPTNKGRVSSPTNAAPLPFRAAAKWTVLDIRRASSMVWLN